ncbi:MAG: carbon-nitrogen hydrolase family protein [Armatimonadetes bacterium]|nr:carbon-nitrogen hydrolase family protein [Armatimonadota bacterium]
MNVTLAAVQMDNIPGDAPANLSRALRLIDRAGEAGAKIVCLPELCTTGYYLTRDELFPLAETVPGRATEAVGEAARRWGMYVQIGMAEKEGDSLYNTAAALAPDGSLLARYRKTHLYGGEKDIFCRGSGPVVFETEYGRVGAMICYDHVFPEFVRGLMLKGADILLHSTAWVTTDLCDAYSWDSGMYHAILRTRALENRVFVVSANRTGAEGPLRHLGNSAIIHAWGEVAARLDMEEGVCTAEADFTRLPPWAEVAPYREDRWPGLYRAMLEETR